MEWLFGFVMGGLLVALAVGVTVLTWMVVLTFWREGF
jgi:hypothetical protein